MPVAAGSIVGGAFDFVVDVEDQLRHIVVPVERLFDLGPLSELIGGRKLNDQPGCPHSALI